MKKLFEKWNSISLILRIAVGLVIGVILALCVPQAEWIKMLGTLFVGALKSIAPILVFVLVISSIAQAENTLGRKFGTVIGLYMLSTLLAATVAVAASFLFPITLQLPPQTTQAAPSGIAEVIGNLLMNVVSNPVASLTSANYIGILAWAVLLGLALRMADAGTKKMLGNLADAVSQVVRWVISFAPFGILGLVFTAIAENGLGIFKTYGHLLMVLVGCMFFMALVVSPLIVAIVLHRNPYPLVFRCLRESGVTAFFTRSSAANIPINLSLCEKLGLDKDLYSVSIPLGATINMDGAAITITVMTLAAAHTMGITVDIPTALLLCVLATAGACGASGVAGGSLLLIPLACSTFGISNDVAMQVVGIGFIIGVVQDSCETALNSASDVLFAATAEYRDWLKQGREIKF